MLQNIRDNSSGIIAKIIVGLIAVTFVITGVNFFNGGGGDTVIAEVDGIEITERRFLNKLERERRQLLSVLGDSTAIDEDLLRQSVLNTLIEEAAATGYSEKLDFGVTDQLIDNVILEIPQFQTDGQFDVRTFDRALGQMGMSRLGFREELKRDLIEYQVRGAVEASTLVTPSKITRLNALQNQRRSGELLIINSDQFLSEVSLAAEEVAEFYNTNKNSFVTEESVALEYILLANDDFTDQVVVTEEDLRTAYDAEVEQSATESERRARHILVADGESALEKITDLKAQIVGGGDFTELARLHSDDIASRDTGGDLGFAPKGTFAPEFEQALDKLAINSVSEPVKTQFGYHLIELLETRTRPVDPFDVSAPRLREDLIEREADRLLADNLEEFSNVAFSGSLEELKSVYSVEIKTTEVFNRSTASGLFAQGDTLQRVFNEALYDGELNAEVFEVEPGLWMTFRIKEFKPKAIRALVEVRDDISDRLRRQKALNRARSLAQTVQQHWQNGGSGLPKDAEALETTLFSDVDRNGNDLLSRDALSVAFAASAPSDGRASTFVGEIANNEVVVARIDFMKLNTEPASDNDLKAPLTQLRINQEGSEFWSVVTTTLEVNKR